ncbi:MAG TPA: hypothetical protein VFX60_12280, partial [Micromonospora sp.]|nr:hypothetical protein [Micromonospora sp.]
MLTALPGFVPVITLICALSFAPDGDRAHPPPLSVAATTHAENDIRYPAGDGTINLAPQPALEVSPLLPPVTRTGSAGSTPGTTAEPGTGDSGPAASESTRPETHVRPP